MRPTVADISLVPLETMATVIEAAAPAGLAAFLRDRFREPDEANLTGTRLEMACAACPAGGGVPFRFAGKGQPISPGRSLATRGLWKSPGKP